MICSGQTGHKRMIRHIQPCMKTEKKGSLNFRLALSEDRTFLNHAQSFLDQQLEPLTTCEITRFMGRKLDSSQIWVPTKSSWLCMRPQKTIIIKTKLRLELKLIFFEGSRPSFLHNIHCSSKRGRRVMKLYVRMG